VLVGHAEAVWVETEEPLTAVEAAEILAGSPGLQHEEFPTPAGSQDLDVALVGRVRNDPASENGLAFFLACDNLRKGAALNAIQIAEVLLDASVAASRS
jgi:aspartate-semialdehyde dehydrogenase